MQAATQAARTVEGLKEKLWVAIGSVGRPAGSTLAHLLRLSHSPIGGIRHAALDVLRAVVQSDYPPPQSITGGDLTPAVLLASPPIMSHPATVMYPFVAPSLPTPVVRSWGLHLVCLSADFRDYVLNQESEQGKEGKEWKYALVQSLARHPALDNITWHMAGGPEFVEQVRRLAARGPFYSGSKMAELQTMEH